MRHKFMNVCCRKTAIRQAPWACCFAKAEAGYIAFESEADYDTWRLTNQGCAQNFGAKVKKKPLVRARVDRQASNDKGGHVQSG
jgi:hypothetical protein